MFLLTTKIQLRNSPKKLVHYINKTVFYYFLERPSFYDRCYLDKFPEESSADVVVRLEEDFTKSWFSDRIVLRVELVEPVERVPILQDRNLLLYLIKIFNKKYEKPFSEVKMPYNPVLEAMLKNKFGLKKRLH